MRPDQAGAVGDRLFQDPGGAPPHATMRERSLQLAGAGDGTGEGTVLVRAFSVEQSLVQMQMGLDKSRDDRVPAAIEDGRWLTVELLADPADAPGFDGNVHLAWPSGNPAVTQHQIRRAPVPLERNVETIKTTERSQPF